MSDANKDLADVRGWLCDNLSSGDAGKVCGMLSSVSRRINELEFENAKLRDAMYTKAKRHALQHMDEDELRIWATSQAETIVNLVEHLMMACEVMDDAVAKGYEDDGDKVERIHAVLRDMGWELDE